jgi:hypothetical protein
MIEFVIKKKDLKQAIEELCANREPHHTDPADIHVTSDTVTFRSVGTATTVTARGSKSGTMRIPLSGLEKAIRRFGHVQKRRDNNHLQARFA